MANRAILVFGAVILLLSACIPSVGPATQDLSPTPAPWLRFVDPQGRFDFHYPPSLPIIAGSAEATWRMGDRIEIVVQPPGMSWITCFDQALGDCPVVDTDGSREIQGSQARRVKGWFGAVGGRIPQEFLVYIFDLGEDSLVMTLFALPFDAELTDVTTVWPLQAEELERFEQVVETVRLAD